MTAKSILVTGASKGIGKEVVIELIKKFNNNVVAVSRTQKDLIDLKHYVENDLNEKGKLEIVVGDVTEERVIDEAIEKSVKTWGKLDGVVANAGILSIGTVANSNIEEWKRSYDVNLFSVVNLMKKSTAQLKQNKGVFVSLSSGAATKEYYGWAIYATTKAALNLLTATFALEEPDIVAISIRPGVVDTDMQKLIRDKGLEMGMNKSDHDRFINLYKSNNLTPVDQSAHVLASLVSCAGEKIDTVKSLSDPSDIDKAGNYKP
ncbi:short-chain dehydrogenase [Rhizophagus clarus]|uniref:Short-chain dehydrogenase n=1 Tax=Rhizophagus clarus TaxID=94130 RepID=A0A8H3LHI4_9GLOM|nr:short-chain dehydrogenase [Rhizophagus clarus]